MQGLCPFQGFALVGVGREKKFKTGWKDTEKDVLASSLTHSQRCMGLIENDFAKDLY